MPATVTLHPDYPADSTADCTISGIDVPNTEAIPQLETSVYIEATQGLTDDDYVNGDYNNFTEWLNQYRQV